jgi:hypothetical protein
MLTKKQVKELFGKLQIEHADTGETRPSVNFTLINGKEISSGADLSPETLRDFSDHFEIPIDIIRECSFKEIELLLLDAFTNADEKDLPSLLHRKRHA